MSYILDALNKSEQERRKQNSAPSFHEVPINRTPEKQVQWVYPSLLAAVVIAAGMGYYLAKSTDTPSSSKGFTDRAQPGKAATVVQQQQKLHEQTPRPRQTAPTNSADSVHSPTTSWPANASLQSDMPQSSSNPDNRVSANAKISAPFVTELTWPLREAIPSIKYTAHVYSDNGGSGFVILNDAKRYDGYRVAEDLYVKQIQKDGVVLTYRGTAFKLSAMKSWNKD